MTDTQVIASNPERIALRLSRAGQLFNSFDPSPFHERELDRDAEAFLTGWLRDIGSKPFAIEIELPDTEAGNAQAIMGPAIRNHFRYRQQMAGRDLRLEMRRGRMAFVIGLLFLGACLSVRELIVNAAAFPGSSILQEGLLIIGWVAMWGPVEVFLYGWWPIVERMRLYERLAAAPVRVLTAPVQQGGPS